MKILQVVSSVDPRSGGPAEGVLQCGVRMNELGHTVEVMSLDDPIDPFSKTYPLRLHALGPTIGTYRYTQRLVPWLRAHATDYDAVILNGLWQYSSYGSYRALRQLNIPYFVFPHGMLDPWFKSAYPLKHAKKWLYWPWSEYRVLRDARAVLFTSEEESQRARQSFWLYRAKERVVAYGTRTPPGDAIGLRETFLAAHPQLRGRRILLFLGRIHEKKACDLLIEAFARMAAMDETLQLVIAGPDQTGVTPVLQAIAQKLGIAERLSWPGMLLGDLKWGAFYAAEVFVLPSHQENFGIAVAEALACGLPVLISDKVNIWREIESAEAGLVRPDTVQGTVELLQQWQSLTPLKRSTMGHAAKRLFEERFTIDAMVRDFELVMRAHSAGLQF